jgi:glycosyltransferase involved in cell wall biosynthesis
MYLKILHAYKSYKPDPTGGIAEAISTLVSANAPHLDHRILIARSCGLSRRFIDNGVPVRAVSSLGTLRSLPIAPGYALAFAREARRADLVIHHAPFPLTDLGLTFPLPKRVTLIIHWHADVVRSRLVLNLIAPLLRHSLRRADRIIVPHQAIIQNSSFLQEFNRKCVVVPYGIDVAYWAELNDQEQRQVHELQKRYHRLIVSTGRLVPYKGYDVLLHALQQIDATLVIIGNGPLRDELLKLAKNLHVIDRFDLVGRQERNNLKLLLHAAQVFAFSSVSAAESFGIAQLEAMAAGLPIVNTALPTAVPHIARDEIEGLTVAPGDANALASALAKLLNDEKRAKQFGRAGRIRVEEKFSHANFRSSITRIYDETVLERRSS